MVSEIYCPNYQFHKAAKLDLGNRKLPYAYQHWDADCNSPRRQDRRSETRPAESNQNRIRRQRKLVNFPKCNARRRSRESFRNNRLSRGKETLELSTQLRRRRIDVTHPDLSLSHRSTPGFGLND